MGIMGIGKALTNEEQEDRKADQERQREEARREHNRRTGGEPVDVDATVQQLEEHNERVAHDS